MYVYICAWLNVQLEELPWANQSDTLVGALYICRYILVFRPSSAVTQGFTRNHMSWCSDQDVYVSTIQCHQDGDLCRKVTRWITKMEPSSSALRYKHWICVPQCLSGSTTFACHFSLVCLIATSTFQIHSTKTTSVLRSSHCRSSQLISFLNKPSQLMRYR